MTIFSLNIFWITIAPSYYWLMYAIGFLAWFYIIKKRWFLVWEKLDNLFMYIVLWVILWWRLWYVFFYNISSYIANPIDILKVWEWWMSFHWWVIWVIIAMLLFSRRYKINFFMLSDQITLVLPIWLWLGRIWNYLNQELLGYSWYNWLLSININWIWYFPSTLIEFLLEWVVLFCILNYFYYTKKQLSGQIASLFLIFYWIFRIIVEIFFRTPDIQIGYILWYFTMWEILSFPMLIIWWFLYYKLWKIK
jgi:phosphatidylglycerol:prolipoprotein diacylglycerol transferase